MVIVVPMNQPQDVIIECVMRPESPWAQTLAWPKYLSCSRTTYSILCSSKSI